MNADEMIYWNKDANEKLSSPYAEPHEKTRYLSFEYDQGGWNNIRMGFESVVAIALGSNRTVVLPPAKSLYLLSKGSHIDHGFLDFFDLRAIEKKFPGLFIEFKDFYRKEHLQLGAGSFKNVDNAKVHSVNTYLRKVGTSKEIDAGKQCLVFGEQRKLTLRATGLCGPERKPLFFNPKVETHVLIHIPMTKHSRLLSHFYAFTIFDDLAFDRFVKRFMRDHLHYLPELFCHAAPIVQALKKESTELGAPNQGYHAFHIRRNDFQFKEAWLEVPDIVTLSKDIPMEQNSFVYISTDEKNKKIFNSMTDRYGCDMRDC